MKTYLFIDSLHHSVMMVIANNPVDASKICKERTDIADDQYILVSSFSHIDGVSTEHSIL